MSTMNDTDDWNEFAEQMSEQFVQAMEQNVEAQGRFVESWFETLDGSMDAGGADETMEGYARAYQAWMDAATEQFERTSDSLEGEDVDVEEFRDLWLNTANEAFSEVMATPAFAAATGETVEEALEMRQQIDEAAQENLSELGFATSDDVVEVGERLVELERRQHAVEEKLDRVLEHLED
jgi:glycogen debranching enzyme